MSEEIILSIGSKSRCFVTGVNLARTYNFEGCLDCVIFSVQSNQRYDLQSKHYGKH